MTSTGYMSGAARGSGARARRRDPALVWLFVAYVALALTCMAVQMAHPPAEADLAAYAEF